LLHILYQGINTYTTRKQGWEKACTGGMDIAKEWNLD